ncbi:hypothetical protein A3A03_03760 [Candidatus Nomurabacteria bacterium RIFCSPLOWO2_01_FULL_40_18]|uniref:Uncharacterized protein n=1 Tax=Candidatus Nomurabacteria bacterium RIFCSPLOWO2_01_FULL_40_18 TaxID=1801773 RepID=A0A1F6XJP9_9BACT|nr:MAG: hypothetical protein A3A03_03760 [Candidatus Nomurabacteria bacterium RIFCSPLOWO2_01_FULL_40_18]
MQMHSATKCLGEWRRSDGLARAEAGSGRESARASAFCFGGILVIEKVDNVIFVYFQIVI